MSLPNSTAISGTPYVGNVDQKTPPTTPNNSGTSSPTKKFQPPPRVVPRSPRSLREFAMDSAHQSRERSGSSPARLSTHSTSFSVAAAPASPTKLPITAPTTPTASPTLTPRSSAKSHVPSLPLSLLTGDATSDDSPRSSPTKSKRLKVSLRTMLPLQSASEGKGSASAPSTTRKGSVSASDPSIKPSTHGADVQASGKKSDSELIALSDEIAGHVVRAIQASGSTSKGMRASDAQLFLSQPVKIPVDQFSPELRKRLPASFKDASITHSALISLLYGSAFDKSPAGNQLSAIRRSVMQDYGDATLTMADLAKREEADPGTKKRYVQNIETKARIFADAAFGKVSSDNPAETFPPELMALWRAMDSKLVEMKPGRTHRERLAYELVMSRMVLTAAKGDDTEAGLAVPTLFLATIKEVSGKQFPTFASAVLQKFDGERSAPSSTAATGLANLSNSSASSTNSTSNLVSNSASNNNPSQ